MITEAVLNVFFVLPALLINLLPSINIALPNDLVNITSTLFKGLGYVLPIAGLMPILLFSLALNSFHIIWAIVIRVKSFIPTMGA